MERLASILDSGRGGALANCGRFNRGRQVADVRLAFPPSGQGRGSPPASEGDRPSEIIVDRVVPSQMNGAHIYQRAMRPKHIAQLFVQDAPGQGQQERSGVMHARHGGDSRNEPALLIGSPQHVLDVQRPHGKGFGNRMQIAHQPRVRVGGEGEAAEVAGAGGGKERSKKAAAQRPSEEEGDKESRAQLARFLGEGQVDHEDPHGEKPEIVDTVQQKGDERIAEDGQKPFPRVPAEMQ